MAATKPNLICCSCIRDFQIILNIVRSDCFLCWKDVHVLKLPCSEGVNRTSFVVGSGTGAALCLLYECNCLMFCVCYTSVIGVFFVIRV